MNHCDSFIKILSHTASLGIFPKDPLTKLDKCGDKKSKCPDQLEAITGNPVIVASNIGLPNPSPCVKLTKYLILG